MTEKFSNFLTVLFNFLFIWHTRTEPRLLSFDKVQKTRILKNWQMRTRYTIQRYNRAHKFPQQWILFQCYPIYFGLGKSKIPIAFSPIFWFAHWCQWNHRLSSIHCQPHNAEKGQNIKNYFLKCKLATLIICPLASVQTWLVESWMPSWTHVMVGLG